LAQSPSADVEARQELQLRFDEYRKERAENERMLQKQVEELREELSGQKMENAKLLAKVEYGVERQKMLESSKTSLQSEMSLLRQKSTQYSTNMDRQLSTIEKLTQDVLKTKTEQSKSEVAKLCGPLSHSYF
jgi:SMC interacting uncharacterized protein involved in chromosome segregation